MLLTTNTTLDEAWHAVVQEIKRGCVDKKHPFRFITLATIAEGKPTARYVVLRKVDEALNCYIYTDSRTAKIAELQQNDAASLLLYHPRKRVQVRLDGQIALHHQDTISQMHWQHVQGEAQKAYNSVLAPGTTIDNRQDAYEWPENMDDRYFTVLAFKPQAVEALQLNGLEHLRASFEKTHDGWQKSWLAP